MRKQLTKIYGTFGLGLLLVPHGVLAAPRNFQDFANQIIDLVNAGTIVLFSAAIAVFFWSVGKNLLGYDPSNAEAKKKMTDTLTWGVLIIFVMVSLWGIIAILQNTLSGGLR